MIDTPSPNHGARPDSGPVDLVVLHYTGMPNARAAIERLCDPAAAVSAHYLIEEGGAVHRLVDEGRRAWHAGAASWMGASDINDRSIGIELVNPGHAFGYRRFPETQMAALEALLEAILARHDIPPSRVVGHSDVAPMRKQDPGELFDWQRLARRGLAFWPRRAVAPVAPEPAAARVLLERCGYRLEGGGDSLTAALTAFQRRFRPSCCDGRLDEWIMGLLAAVAEEMR